MFGNLHRIASRYIPQQTALWFRFKNREPDERGHDQNQYHEPVEIRGSWQAVNTQDAQSMGFDSNQIYRRFYTSHDIKGIQRGTSPDYLVFNGKKYDVMGDADWYEQDGWKSVICIEVGAYDG
ncbi:phage collar protein [Providencia huashanensis]|uniref:phage collar protein n=1 Tax=Providencia huashanensis TaxID=3037798 RepID=UPI00404610FB